MTENSDEVWPMCATNHTRRPSLLRQRKHPFIYRLSFNHKGGKTMQKVLGIILIVVILGGWPQAVYKLCTSDFEAPYKREAVYAIGVFVPPTALVIGWLNIEDKPAD